VADVVGFAPGGRRRTSDAAAVPDDEGAPLADGDGPARAADVDRLAGASGDDAGYAGVAGETACGFAGDGSEPVERRGRGAGSVFQGVEVDGDGDVGALPCDCGLVSGGEGTSCEFHECVGAALFGQPVVVRVVWGGQWRQGGQDGFAADRVETPVDDDGPVAAAPDVQAPCAPSPVFPFGEAVGCGAVGVVVDGSAQGGRVCGCGFFRDQPVEAADGVVGEVADGSCRDPGVFGTDAAVGERIGRLRELRQASRDVTGGGGLAAAEPAPFGKPLLLGAGSVGFPRQPSPVRGCGPRHHGFEAVALPGDLHDQLAQGVVVEFGGVAGDEGVDRRSQLSHRTSPFPRPSAGGRRLERMFAS
jgi:hypothetical protein